MPIRNETSRARFDAMGIELWELRGRRSAERAPRSAVDPGGRLRIRLSSGDGDWLLVLEGTVPAACQRLVADITAAVGFERCRFGQWAYSPEAGVGPDEWSQRGIKRVLAFGEPRIDDDRVIAAPGLDQLAGSADARRTLWSRMKAALEA